MFGKSNMLAIGAHLNNLFLYSIGMLGLPQILCAFFGLLLNGTIVLSFVLYGITNSPNLLL